MWTWGAETGNREAGLHSFIQPTYVELPLCQEDRSDRSERTLGVSTLVWCLLGQLANLLNAASPAFTQDRNN